MSRNVFHIGCHHRTAFWLNFEYITSIILLKDLMHCFQAIIFLVISLGENFSNSLLKVDASVEFVFWFQNKMPNSCAHAYQYLRSFFSLLSGFTNLLVIIILLIISFLLELSKFLYIFTASLEYVWLYQI